MASGVYLTFFGSFVFGTPGFPLSDVPLQQIAADAAAGRLDVKPARIFRFDEIHEAHRVMEANEAARQDGRGPRLTRHRSESRRTQMSKSVAIVTGASQGIGQATAIRLARDFSALVLVARNRANLDADRRDGRSGRRRSAGHRCRPGPSPTAAQAVVDQTLAAFGRIDALLNIAGAVPQIDLFEMTDEQWEGGLALKLHGARRLTIAAWPALKAAKGAVVLMSGNSALFPKAPYAAVGTINAAIVALAKAFSDRGIADGVQVNSVLPGPGDDRPPALLSPALGAAARHDGGGGDGQLPEGGRHRPLRRAGGDRRADGVPGVARRALDDRLDASHGRRRGEVDLTKTARSQVVRTKGGASFHSAEEVQAEVVLHQQCILNSAGALRARLPRVLRIGDDMKSGRALFACFIAASLPGGAIADEQQISWCGSRPFALV